MTKKNIGLNFDQLLEKLRTYNDEEELEVVKKAYTYAAKMHFGVKRMTGEDYIEHPLNVAYILAEMNADCATIAAALLHDVLEDCDVTYDELQEMFGKEITDLVDGVTKINKLNFETGSNAVIATQRKILVGLCNDVRVIIIKLADRLHNMRTLWVHTEKKQKEKAKETLDILVPIAHRLGINKMKSELEDLSLRYYRPDIYFDVVQRLNQSKAERDQVVKKMMDDVSALLNEAGIKHEIKGRAKSIFSIYKKMDKGKKFSDIFDLLALRIFVDTEEECYHALGVIHSKYKPMPKRFKDYIAMPKTNMYQSLHTTVFGLDEYLFEIQIRTYEMDEVAERGIASHWSYKEQGSNKIAIQNQMEQKLQFFRSIIELNNDESNDEEFVKSVTEDVLNNTIYVFTPRGDVIELPKGSTPIDFAYRVHTDVGDKMVGAIVNNVIVPFDHELKDNDIIKINTNKNSFGPSREWINMAKTTGAKNKIKSFYRKIEKEEYLKKGEEALNKELRKRKIIFSDFLTNENMDKIIKELKYTNFDEVYINIGNNKLAIGAVINIVTGENNTKEDIILRKTQNKEVVLPSVKTDIIVEGIEDIKVNVASCCKPVPGDRIIGYITKGYGISVHRLACPNVKDLEERTISVRWNEVINKKYPTNLIIKTLKNDNLLLDIIAKTSNNNLTIQSIYNYNSKGDNTYDITVLVDNKENLKKFMAEVDSISSVTLCERHIK